MTPHTFEAASMDDGVSMRAAQWTTLVLVMLAACGSQPIEPDTGAADGAADASGDADTSGDAEPDADAGSVLTCDFPPPVLGASAEALALASAPARCGQPDHAWLDDDRLGDVISRRRVNSLPTSLLNAAFESQGIVPARALVHDVTVDQILYVTQDRGSLVEATAAVSYPTGGFDDAGPRDILLLLHGSAGFADACAPSNDLAGQALAALFASWGYVVVSPDYLGLKGAGDPSEALHPSASGQALAISSLDAVRALAKLAPSERGDTCLNARVLIYGVSQGGMAALWVDRLSPYYAAELDLVGTVAAIPPLDMLAQAELGLAGILPATGFVVTALASTAPWYGVEGRLSEFLVPPYDTELPAALALGCTDDAPASPTFTSVDEFIQPGVLDAVSAGTFAGLDPWGCMLLEADTLSTSIPRVGSDSSTYGILITLGSEDELVDAPIARAATQTLCEAGVSISVLECEGASHLEGGFWSMPEALEFLDARAAGEPFVSASCVPPAPVSCRGAPP